MDSKEQIKDEAAADEVCANCGKAAVDEIKLKKCGGCELVKYCSVDCQKNHRPQHKKACKKRLAEMRDDELFSQPDESHYGECPICCLPLPLDESQFGVFSCCCKRICHGCYHANKQREREHGLEQKCPFCREPLPKTKEDIKQNYTNRAKVNDPIALFQVGVKCLDKGDYEGSFEYFTKAAALGDMDAHYNLSIMYATGEGVEKDEKKEVYHLEEAAIGGHQQARFNLGVHEGENGHINRVTEHFIIAAKLGLDKALEAVKKGFHSGVVCKEDFEAALRGHQAAVDATQSEQREKASAFFKRNGSL
jgi:hypothetical protein